MNPEAMARIFKKLMAALGYESYFIQGLSLSLISPAIFTSLTSVTGGDWGSIVGTYLAMLDADHVRGLHVNFLPVGPFDKGFFAVSRCFMPAPAFPSLIW